MRHLGDTVEHGHYTTDVRLENGSWLRTNDASVRAVRQNDVLQPSESAYILVYTLMPPSTKVSV